MSRPPIADDPTSADTLSDAEAVTRDDVLEMLGIARYAQAYPRDLSVGERQRAALGAVIAAQPRLLLLDEPTRGLDAASRHKLADVLKRLANDGAGVLLATHDRVLVQQCAHRIVKLEHGLIHDS